jgi:spore coat polysaccharide biosynthesis protein SpsF
MLKVVAIVQARMGSTRLPGKVLKDLEGETLLARVVNRLRRARLINEVLVATTDRAADDAIVKECRSLSVLVSRGDQDDVLDRYFRAAQLAKAEVVVRVTSDCPLIDPEIADKTIAAFLEASPDYASNALMRTYPRGLDTEVMSVATLGRAWQGARKRYEREHVTPYIYEHPAEFKLLSVTGDADYGSHRWTVDTPEDLEFVRAIYIRLKDNPTFAWRDVLDLLDREPELMELNRSVMQKALHEG